MASNNVLETRLDNILDADEKKNLIINSDELNSLFEANSFVFKIKMTKPEKLNYWISKDLIKPEDCDYLPTYIFNCLPYYWNKIIAKRIAPGSNWCDLYAHVNIMYFENYRRAGMYERFICNRPTEFWSLELLYWQLNISTGLLRIHPAYELAIRNVPAINHIGCLNTQVMINQDFVVLRVRYTRATLRAIVMLMVIAMRAKRRYAYRKMIALEMENRLNNIPASLVVSYVWGYEAFKPNMLC